MDFLAVLLALSVVGNLALGLLAVKVARDSGRTEAHNKILLSQIDELKQMVAGADFAQLQTTRLMQQAEARAREAQAEIERARMLQAETKHP